MDQIMEEVKKFHKWLLFGFIAGALLTAMAFLIVDNHNDYQLKIDRAEEKASEFEEKWKSALESSKYWRDKRTADSLVVARQLADLFGDSIKIKYVPIHNNIRSLPLDGQVRFISGRLPKTNPYR